MKTIKIFLASSDELKDDRDRFGNLVRRLGRVYYKRGIRLDLIEWEDLDAAWNGMRKQDEYNQEIPTSDMFLAVFYRKAGKYTIEEFNVAMDEHKAHGVPKIFVYIKDLAPGETEDITLTEFKKKLYNEFGHYWSRYGNSDTMQLHFVLQLQYVEGRSPKDSGIQIEDSKVKLDGLTVADLNKVPFAANNPQHIEYKTQIEKIQNTISSLEGVLAAGPNEQIENQIGQQRTELHNLRQRMAEFETSLLSTASTIISVLGKATSERLRRAIELFESGDNHGANAVLDSEADKQN